MISAYFGANTSPTLARSYNAGSGNAFRGVAAAVLSVVLMIYLLVSTLCCSCGEAGKPRAGENEDAFGALFRR